MLYLLLAGLTPLALAAGPVTPEVRTYEFAVPEGLFFQRADVKTPSPPDALTFTCTVGKGTIELPTHTAERREGKQLYRTDGVFWVGTESPSNCAAQAIRPAEMGSKGTTSAFATTAGDEYVRANPPIIVTSLSAPTTSLSAATGPRSTGVPSIVTDTLSILAEIAYEQAKSRAYDTVADGVRTQVCDRLVLVRPLPISWTNGKGKWEISLPEGAILPGTCDTLESHSDFISLVNAADELAGALVGDVVTFGGNVTRSLVEAKQNDSPIIPSEWARGEIKKTLDIITQVLRDNAIDRTPPDIADARLLLAKMADRDWAENTAQPGAEQAAQVALKSVFVLSAACVTQETSSAGVTSFKVCSASEVVEKLKLVEEAQTDTAIREAFKTFRPDVEALALDVIRIAASSDRGDTTAVVQASFRAVFDLVELLFSVVNYDPAPSEDTDLFGSTARALSNAKVSQGKDEQRVAAENLLKRAGDVHEDFKARAAAAQETVDKTRKDIEEAEKSKKDGEKAARAARAAIAEAEAAQAAAQRDANAETNKLKKLEKQQIVDAKNQALNQAREKLNAANNQIAAADDTRKVAERQLALAEQVLELATSREEWAESLQASLAALNKDLSAAAKKKDIKQNTEEMLALVYESRPPDGLNTDSQEFILDVVHGFRGVVLALAENDVGTALSEGCQLLLTLLESDSPTGGADEGSVEDKARWVLTASLRRVVPVVGVLASNAHSLAQASANPDDAEALRAARKEALEGVIKASTNRSGRDGNWVTSLGANVGVNLIGVGTGSTGDGPTLSSFGYDFDAKQPSTSAVPLMLPMGIAVQRLPNPQKREYRNPKGTGGLPVADKAGGIASYFGEPSERTFAFNGYHFQASVVDLAQFLGTTWASNDLDWSDFVLVGGQLGVAFGRPQDQLVLGIDGRYAPYSDSAFRMCLFASYYVPFFDFN